MKKKFSLNMKAFLFASSANGRRALFKNRALHGQALMKNADNLVSPG